MLTPAQLDLDISIQRDFVYELPFTDEADNPTNLTGYTFKAQIREATAKASVKIADFVIDTTDVATGIIVLTLTDTITGAITQSAGYWDLILTDPTGLVQTYLFGDVTFVERPTDNV